MLAPPAEAQRGSVLVRFRPLHMIGLVRLLAGRLLCVGAEPLPYVNDKRDQSEHKHKMDSRHDRYLWGVMLHPFHPGQQSRSRDRSQKFPSGPQPSPEPVGRNAIRVPKDSIDNPPSDSPMNRSSHPCRVTALCEIGRSFDADLIAASDPPQPVRPASFCTV
jgi:hypothetical protein